MPTTASNLLLLMFFRYFPCLFPEFNEITLGFWLFGEAIWKKYVFFSTQGRFTPLKQYHLGFVKK